MRRQSTAYFQPCQDTDCNLHVTYLMRTLHDNFMSVRRFAVCESGLMTRISKCVLQWSRAVHLLRAILWCYLCRLWPLICSYALGYYLIDDVWETPLPIGSTEVLLTICSLSNPSRLFESTSQASVLIRASANIYLDIAESLQPRSSVATTWVCIWGEQLNLYE